MHSQNKLNQLKQNNIMKKFIMLEVSVQVDTDLENVNDIVDNLEINVNGDDVVEVTSSQVENFYKFDA